MSSSPTVVVTTRPGSQLASGLSRPTETGSHPAGGLGIEGITTQPEHWSPETDHETEDRSSSDTAQQYLRPPEKDHNDLNLTPAVVNDLPRIQNRLPSSCRKYLALSILSTILSLAYVVIAIWGPVWNIIRDPAISKTVASLVAKAIEATFASTCVLYIGQLLTRRSTSIDTHNGLSLDQISMRDWIIDPGSMLGDEKTLWLGTTSFLGWYVVIAAVSSLLYGTASSSLIQPVLKDTPARHITMSGMVKTSFANESYLEKSYTGSLGLNLTLDDDRSFMGVVYSARGSNCWNTFLTTWDSTGNHTPIQSQRPSPWTLDRGLQGQINGSWVQSIDMQTAFQKFARVVDNVTLAIAHPDILQVAKASKSIAQPKEFQDGMGRYKLQAQIPSPYVNVVCANIKRADLDGLVYEDQVNGQLNTSDSDAPENSLDPRFVVDFNWTKYATVKTPLDDIFGWDNQNKRPIFYRYPMASQTILNRTIGSLLYNSFGRESVYLLGAPASNANSLDNSTLHYSLCSMQAGLLADCYTELATLGNSSVMVSHCAESNNGMSYAKRNASAKDTVKQDWVAVGSLAATSMGLNGGETGGAGDNENYLTKLFLTNPSLPLDRPSMAEGLASMMMPALVMAAQDSSFDITWDPSQTIPANFPALLHPNLFASGGSEWYKRLYIIIFILVFLMNTYMLYYLFILHNNDITIDICDPINLFGLAASSRFDHFPESSLILSPKKEPRERPLSREWKVKRDENGRMEIALVSDEEEGRQGGSPNEVEAVRTSGFTPLLGGKGWGGGKNGVEESIEMV